MAFVIFVCVALAGLEIWREYLAYRGELEEAEAQTLNIAKSLAQHAEDTIDTADNLLVAVVQHYENERLDAGRIDKLRNHLVAQVQEAQRLRGLFIYDKAGDLLTSSMTRQPTGLNIADRHYFQHHAASADRGPYVGMPVRSRATGNWILTVTRRLQDRDGSFAGIAVASIEATYFTRFFSQFDLGTNGNITLFRRDGTILARWPHEEASLGRVFAGGSLLGAVARSPVGNRHYVSPVDGIERISGYKQGARFGLVIQAAVAKEDALAKWRDQSTWRAAGIALLIVLIAVIGLRLADQVRRREGSEAALQESETRFRLLAENSSDMVSRISSEGKRLYVSPAAERLLGWSAEELKRRSPLQDIHPDDHEQILELVRQMRAGDLREATVTYRALHRTGRELWLETSLRVTHDSITNVGDGVVAVTRDVTERKALEATLSTMARTDGLTGLANRRGFDEVLLAECARAHREGTALSLLLLDVDRFKLFNDAYGHHAGDECLQAVARAVAGLVRRPGDLAARYGGEEMAFLLAGTSELGAISMGERVREAVQALAIRHDGNPPSNVVTVSVGLATFAPSKGKGERVTPEALIEAADQALYRAKQGGRNRVAAAPAMVGSRRAAA